MCRKNSTYVKCVPKLFLWVVLALDILWMLLLICAHVSCQTELMFCTFHSILNQFKPIKVILVYIKDLFLSSLDGMKQIM